MLLLSELGYATVTVFSALLGLGMGVLSKIGGNLAAELLKSRLTNRTKAAEIARERWMQGGFGLILVWADSVEMKARAILDGRSIVDNTDAISASGAVAAAARVDRRFGTQIQKKMIEVNRVMRGLSEEDDAPGATEEQRRIITSELQDLIRESEFWLLKVTEYPLMSSIKIYFLRKLNNVFGL